MWKRVGSLCWSSQEVNVLAVVADVCGDNGKVPVASLYHNT